MFVCLAGQVFCIFEIYELRVYLISDLSFLDFLINLVVNMSHIQEQSIRTGG